MLAGTVVISRLTQGRTGFHYFTWLLEGLSSLWAAELWNPVPCLLTLPLCSCHETHRPIHIMSTGFAKNKLAREHKKVATSSLSMNLRVAFSQFCSILSVRSKSPGPVHMQGHRYQEAGITGCYLGAHYNNLVN